MQIAKEVVIFLYSCLLGAGLAMFYDVFRIIRISFKNSKILIFIEDLIYFIVITIVSFTFIIMQNDGRLRGFLVVGEILGATIYFFTFSIIIMKIAHIIINIVRKILMFIFKITIKPIVKLCVWLYNKIKKGILSLKVKISRMKFLKLIKKKA